MDYELDDADKVAIGLVGVFVIGFTPLYWILVILLFATLFVYIAIVVWLVTPLGQMWTDNLTLRGESPMTEAERLQRIENLAGRKKTS